MTDQKDPPDQRLHLYTTDVNGATVTLEALKVRRGYPWRFGTMMLPQFHMLAEMDRPSVYYRVMLHLFSVLDAQQWRQLTAATIARDCSMSVQSAEKALTMLTADRVIFCRGPRSHKERRINNTLAWFAGAARHSEAEADLPVIDARGRG